MEILASCTLEESKKYAGKLVVQDENEKPVKVSLNIVSDGSIESKDLGPNVKTVTFIGDDWQLASRKDGVSYFHEVPLGKEPKLVEGIIPLIRVPDGYSNMMELSDVCNKIPNSRLIGGNLLAVEGVRIGRFDDEKKLYPVYNGIYDNFIESNLSEIGNLTEVMKKARKKLGSSDAKKKGKSTTKAASKPKKSSMVAKSFTSLFSDSDGEEF